MLRREGIAREPIDDEDVLRDLVARTERALEGEEIDILINDACYQEERRLARSKDDAELAYLESLRGFRKRLGRTDAEGLRDIVREIARFYGKEIHGHFDPQVYANATRVLPRGLALLLRRQDLGSLLTSGFSGLQLADRIRVGGEIAWFDRLCELGTCVLVPTHVSNLDSPVIGFALHQAGLPPMIYGAGKNLFTNWLLSYFMDHLGAYRVDRQKGHNLYKTVLKEYSTLALRRRWHSLFFPGGTRARSGMVEKKLKKGLMGTALSAYQENLAEGRDKARLWFIPATINYHLVLEAETLIDDHLQEAGKSRYIISDDEFSRPEKVLGFTRNMLTLDNPVEVVFGRPLDPFGNAVDRDGLSVDPQGRSFDPAGYVQRGGRVAADPQRDHLYTERLAERIVEAFHRDTVLFETHVVAAAAHRCLERGFPNLDLYRRLLLPLDHRRIPTAELDAELRSMLDALRAAHSAGKVRLGELLLRGAVDEVRVAALQQFALFHSKKALWGREGAVIIEDPRLALYYANRVQGFPLPPLRAGGAA